MENDVMSVVNHILNKLQDGYTKRDINMIDSYMDELFVKGSSPVILGTSNGELCIGFDSARELIKSDWEYWGDVKLDIDKVHIHHFDDLYWFSVPGTVKNTFRTNENTWVRYISAVKDNLEAAKKSPVEGLTMISWMLSHLLFPRDGEERSYGCPIRLTGAVVLDKDDWRIKYLQFSIPCSVFPDERVGTEVLDSMYSNAPFSVDNFDQGQCSDEILSAIKGFADSIGAGDIKTCMSHISQSSGSLYISPTQTWYGGDSIKDGLESITSKWGQMKLDLNHALVFEAGNSAWIVCGGEMEKTLEEEDALRSQIADIENIIASGIPEKEKLFYIQRNINATYKEIASGALRRWPCRFEAVLTNSNGCRAIHHIQLSFPFSWILEGKVDSVRL